MKLIGIKNITVNKCYKKLSVLSALVVILCSNLSAQDYHFSQFNLSPQNLNPAQTGLFNGDWRFVGNMRSQWSAVPVPYRTYSLSADIRLSNLLKSDVPAVGILINTDKAGDSRMKTSTFYASLGYIKKLNTDSTHFISIGIQPGLILKSFNAGELTFDSQYDGDAYNSSLPSNENFTNTRVTLFDIGGGINYLYRKNNRKLISLGVAGFHLNKPKEKFYDNSPMRLDIKTTVSVMAEYPITRVLDLIPTVAYSQQGKYSETIGGLFGKYYLKPVNGMITAVSLGAMYRLKDAVIIAANLDYRNVTVGVSYDVNTSKLIAATNHRGGFEISLIYIFRKVPPFVAKTRVCPVFM